VIEFLTSDRSKQVLLERGGLPATRGVVYSDAVVAAALATPDVPDFVAQLHSALLAARPRPAVPHYAQFSATFRTAVDDSLRHDVDLSDDDLRRALNAGLHGQARP
jgi:multiple sugar transport system substrate-binding protein